MVYCMQRIHFLLVSMLITALLSACSHLSEFGADSRTRVKDNSEVAKQQFSQGLDVTQGRGTSQDYQQGVRLFEQSAMNGSPKGAYLAGMSYLTRSDERRVGKECRSRRGRACLKRKEHEKIGGDEAQRV